MLEVDENLPIKIFLLGNACLWEPKSKTGEIAAPRGMGWRGGLNLVKPCRPLHAEYGELRQPLKSMPMAKMAFNGHLMGRSQRSQGLGSTAE